MARDFVIMLSDHGSRFLAELRDNGRLIERRWFVIDELVVDNELGAMIRRHHTDTAPRANGRYRDG